VGALRGGRRLLSDDLALLEAAALAAARRIDALRVARERWDREVREREMRQLATEAELRALRAQLNPHFLFNALTTIGHLLQEAPDRALSTLLRLTGLLRAVLRPTVGELATLAEEMEIVEAYLAIEQARFEERLRVRVDVPELRARSAAAAAAAAARENAVSTASRRCAPAARCVSGRAGGSPRRRRGGARTDAASCAATGAGGRRRPLARRRGPGARPG
jgi:two-component system LytT family sensor kinase